MIYHDHLTTVIVNWHRAFPVIQLLHWSVHKRFVLCDIAIMIVSGWQLAVWLQLCVDLHDDSSQHESCVQKRSCFWQSFNKLLTPRLTLAYARTAFTYASTKGLCGACVTGFGCPATAQLSRSTFYMQEKVCSWSKALRAPIHRSPKISDLNQQSQIRLST